MCEGRVTLMMMLLAMGHLEVSRTQGDGRLRDVTPARGQNRLLPLALAKWEVQTMRLRQAPATSPLQ